VCRKRVPLREYPLDVYFLVAGSSAPQLLGEGGIGFAMPTIDLHYVDELIAVRHHQHGGLRGAPPIRGGHRIGVSINRSCVVMLSALLQAYVEEVFQEAARRAFPELNADPLAFEQYWKQMKSWGNPSDVNIKNLFLKVGVPDVFNGLTWQATTPVRIKRKLYELNRLRNEIAHGNTILSIDDVAYSLTLAKVVVFRNFTENFAARFPQHVEGLIP